MHCDMLRFIPILVAACGLVPSLLGADAAPNVPRPAFSIGGFHPVAGSGRTVRSFNPGWRFLKADAAGAEKPDFDDSAWEAANLPHGLEVLGENASGGRNYQGPAWYRKRFDAARHDGRTYLYFEGVMGACSVWINGIKVAEHLGGYLPFVVDAGPALNANGTANVVAVRADNANDPTYPPGKPQNNLDFTYLGGIYRDVALITTPAVHVTLQETSPTVAGGGVFVATKDVHGTDAELEVRTEIANDGTKARKLTLRTVLEDASGKDLLAQEAAVELAAGATRQLSQQLSPRQVHLWHPDDPYLHFIRSEIVEDGAVTDALRTRFGIRLFEMRGKAGFFINKTFIGAKLSGVNRHQDYQFIGNALPNSGQWRDVKLLREGGCTIIRAAHYPMDPAFYDACDELGMLVTTANPGWQFFNFKLPAFEQRLYDDTRALVRRDRNHPSMLLWETALNETPDQPERTLKGMNRVANEEYPFPGFFTVADIDEGRKGGFNFYYHGSDPAINSFTREYGDGGEVDNFGSQNASTRVKREWGEAPLIGQAIIRARDLDGIYGTSPIRLGGALWCGIDHQRGYHNDPFWGGLLDGARMPRYSYFLFKSQYHPTYTVPGIATGPMVFIAHELTQVSGNDVIVYSNCEQVRLTWLGAEVATQKPDGGYKSLPHPPFTFKNAFRFEVIKRDWRSKTNDISMLAEGLIGGSVVVSERKRYPTASRKVQVRVDDLGLALRADGSDVVPLRATIVDGNGSPKVLASEEVTFEVEGPGEIIGPFARTSGIRSEFGTATALLRATTVPGQIRVRARAHKLASSEVVIQSLPADLPLAMDGAYAAASRRPAAGPAPSSTVVKESGDASGEVQRLREQVIRLQNEVTSKQQDLMELRSKGK